MLGWLIFIGCVGIYIYGLKFFHALAFKRHFIKWEKQRALDARRYPSLYEPVPSLSEYDSEKDYANIDAVFLGIFWPITWMYFLFTSMITLKAEPDTPQYNKLKQEKELRELRKLAREHGLSLPEALDK